jgi:MoaA/NifB/PqqE/SkfB family radical SAM enzyme
MKAKEKEYLKGWYAKERDDKGPFRWMSKEAVVSLEDYTNQGQKFLRITAGHSFPGKNIPVMDVFVNNRKIGRREVEAAFSSYVFAFSESGDLTIDIKLDRTFQVEGDPRDMGIMVRDVEVLTPSEVGVFLDGWYLPEAPIEDPKSIASRWMKKEAKCLFFDLPKDTEKYLLIEAGHPYYEGAENPVLTVLSEGKSISSREIIPGETKYYFPLDFSSTSFEIEMRLNRVFPPDISGDPRKLGIFLKNIQIVLPDQEGPLYDFGWHEWEHDEFFPYAWMKQRACVFLPTHQLQTHKFISVYAFSEYANYKQVLQLELDGKELGAYPLIKSWNFYSFPLPSIPPVPKEHSGHKLVLSLNRVFPEKCHKEDSRELGIKVSPLQFYNEDEIHEEFLFFHKNAMLNYEERKQGKTELRSYPINLGIDLLAKCNMKPPCVYCLWDWMKEEEEGHIETVVDEKTFEEYGPFFRSARLLINCSIGEPLLHPRFAQIMEYCTRHKKIMEISTNGQAFTQRTINALVGKPIYLYISLDAATKETYAKIRNDRWKSIIPNLVLLNQERKNKGNLPKIHMVFMPMRVNRDDLEDYFRLCQKIEADALILRPLLVLNKPKIEHERGGYLFDYKNELLSREELEAIFKKCAIYSKKYGVPVANQFSFGTRDEVRFKGKEALDLETQRF